MSGFSKFQKQSLSAILASLALTSFSSAEAAVNQKSTPTNSSEQKNEKSDLTGYYFGGFGGWGFNSFNVVQNGIAFYLSPAGGPLVVSSDGSTNSNGYGFGGVHVGYEWLSKNERSWSITPGVELEGSYFSQTKKVTLVNPTDRLDFHEFEDTLPMRTGVIIADFMLALTNEYITPYISGGLGAAITSIHDADSTQTEFPEPGINHFNSNPDAFNWGFAAQFKGGVRYSFFKHMRLFAEYRYLFIAAKDYTFGNTVYPGHVATADWSVSLGGISNNIFTLGLDFPI